MDLKQLEKEVNEAQIKVNKLREQINKVEFETRLPDLKELYQDKYWKYKNLYGGGHKGWWLYSYCIKITSLNTATFNRFESNPVEHTFRIPDESIGFHLCQIEITKEEYMKALKKFLSTANKLNN